MKYTNGVEVAKHLLQIFGLGHLTGVTSVDVSASVDSVAKVTVSMLAGAVDPAVSTRTFEVKEVINSPPC